MQDFSYVLHKTNMPKRSSTPSAPQQQTGSAPNRDEFESLKWIVYFVLVILGIGLVGLIIQNFIASSVAFNNLTNQVNQQNTAIQVLGSKIDALTDETNQQKLPAK